MPGKNPLGLDDRISLPIVARQVFQQPWVLINTNVCLWSSMTFWMDGFFLIFFFTGLEQFSVPFLLKNPPNPGTSLCQRLSYSTVSGGIVNEQGHSVSSPDVGHLA